MIRVVTQDQLRDGYLIKAGPAVYRCEWKVLYRYEDGIALVVEPEPEYVLY